METVFAAQMADAQMAQLQVWRADVVPFRHTDTIELEEGASYHVGRTVGSALPLSDSRVSGRHAVFTAQADGASVCDHSTNGTYLNGKRLEKGVPIALADGDVITPLVPLKQPPSEGCEPRADLVVAVVYRSAVAAPCGLLPTATGEASAQGSADSPDQPPDLAASSPPLRSSPPDPVEPPAKLPARPPARPQMPSRRPSSAPHSESPTRRSPPDTVEPPAAPPVVSPAKPHSELPAAAEPAQPSAAFDFDMDAPPPPRGRRRSDGGSGSGGGSGTRLTGGRLSKAKRRRGSDATADDPDADQPLPGGRRTSTTLSGDVLCFMRDDGS